MLKLKFVIRLLLSVIVGTASYFLFVLLFYANLFEISDVYSPYISIVAGCILGLLFLILFSSFFASILVVQVDKAEERMAKMSLKDLLTRTAGMVIGLTIANLLGLVISHYGIIGTIAITFLNVILGYLGFRVAVLKKDEVFFDKTEHPLDAIKPKILDTSVIIDGRIMDIIKTGFIEGTIIIPSFILDELRHVADSSEALRRNRGRRGLDVLNEIQKTLPVNVEIVNWDSEDKDEVDIKLLKMAQKLDAFVMTNDFNLNKVADFKGVSVLNINELANAVKPVVLPGEEFYVDVIKGGKEYGQGVGYLNDGTMIVVEGGNKYIGETVDVLVTSVLQTAAGRMIFTKAKEGN